MACSFHADIREEVFPRWPPDGARTPRGGWGREASGRSRYSRRGRLCRLRCPISQTTSLASSLTVRCWQTAYWLRNKSAVSRTEFSERRASAV